MKNKILVCILFLSAPLFCKAQHYDGYASSCYDDRCTDFTISSYLEGQYRIYKIKNVSEERFELCLFTKTTTGRWVMVGNATLDPNKKTSDLIQKNGTDRTLLFYYLSDHREKIPTVGEVNRIEASY